MINKPTAIFIAIAASIFLFNFNSICIKNDFDQPAKYKLTYLSLNLIAYLAKLFDRVNIVSESKFLRDAIDFLSFSGADTNDKYVKIENKILNDVGVRIYTALKKPNDPSPFMIYFHGGGYAIRNMDSYDTVLSQISNETNITIISVDYRLAPEFPAPIPTNDCWRVIEYVLENSGKLNVDLDRLILAGDSAGGNAALVLSKRLALEKKLKPIFQILMYPWTQLAFGNMPSFIGYQGGLLNALDLASLKLWYVGLDRVTDEMKNSILSNNHTLLLDENERENMRSYLNTNLIEDKYKKNTQYFKLYESTNLINSGSLDKNDILNKDSAFAQKVKRLFSEEVSPGLASLDQLKYQPKTYEIICEFDSLKDEGLILGERLRQAGVQVHVAYYDQCFHGMVSMLHSLEWFHLTKTILSDVIFYINSNL
ncbi:Arylacetamide deacetylase [Brachionus plicatilis]|uniref:Arylacetamide deacetylase n=1 Tax=Brachionus plicatilis TaxID=10195 RepID=A0A3M7R4H9_BRAPC|nr:Arylacetamide deacetylase [Brachionus plicatilis]